MTDKRDETGRWLIGEVPETLYMGTRSYHFKYWEFGLNGRAAVIKASHAADRAIWKMMAIERNSQ